MQVLKTEQEGCVATLTASIGDDDHRFEIWADGDTAFIEYQESLSWRGIVQATEPDEDIYRSLMVSDEVTEFLDEHECDSVKRADPKP